MSKIARTGVAAAALAAGADAELPRADALAGIIAGAGAGVPTVISPVGAEGRAALQNFMSKLLESGRNAADVPAADVARLTRLVEHALAELREKGTGAFIASRDTLMAAAR